MPPDPGPLEDLDVAVAHWHVNAWGGAEYLVTRLAEALDTDRIYTLGSPSPATPNPYGGVEFVDVVRDLEPRPLRRLQRRLDRVFEYALWEDVDWRDRGDPDVLVTSGATTRAVITGPETLHVNYCHSPPRWFYDRYHDRASTPLGIVARPLLRHLRTRDAAIDPRVDFYFANSPVIERRLWKYYKRDAEVLYPPIDVSSYETGDRDGSREYYLHLGRLDTEKGMDALVTAFESLNERLVLAGGRGDLPADVMDRIETADSIEYRGFVDEATKRDLLAGAKALVFNARAEDFGIVVVEALASGTPVLARSEGYPATIVTDGVNGLLHDGTPAGIRSAVGRFVAEGISGNPREFAERFDRSQFERQLRASIRREYDALMDDGRECVDAR